MKKCCKEEYLTGKIDDKGVEKLMRWDFCWSAKVIYRRYDMAFNKVIAMMMNFKRVLGLAKCATMTQSKNSSLVVNT